MKKNILLFGASGYVGRHFIGLNSLNCRITSVLRADFDFFAPRMDELIALLDNKKFDSIIFLQGINPRYGVDDIGEQHFSDMVKINITTPLDIIRNIYPYIREGASVVFISSIAAKKGSYDPSYAVSKSGLVGLQQTLSNRYPLLRFNIISLGLVEGSPVHLGMTEDFEQKHLRSMGGKLVNVKDACKAIEFLIECDSISRATIAVDRGFKI